LTLPARAPPLVSVVLPTRRPGLLAAAVGMVRAQAHPRVELVVALHGVARAALPAGAARALAAADVVVDAPAAWSLGRCLNEAARAARGDVLAKVDDDDLYGPDYLGEAVGALLAGRGDVVGKTEMYVHLAGTGELILWRPGASEREQDYVMGGTLAFWRELADRPAFEDVSQGEVAGFQERCRALGRRVYATSRRHFVLRRLGGAHGHTWNPDEGLFRREGVVVRRGVAANTATLLTRLLAPAAA
jgi:hypothetical protein